MDGYSAELPRLAFADESFREDNAGGFYVIAAAVFEAGTQEMVRDELRVLRGINRGGKLHWNDMDVQQQHNAAKKIAELDGFHVVVVGTPVPPRRQERARARCLRRLVFELYSYGVQHLLMEARSEQLNARDVRGVVGARYEMVKGAVFRISHLPGHLEPLLWAADVVAGVVRSGQEGQLQNRELLRDCLYEVDLSTGC